MKVLLVLVFAFFSFSFFKPKTETNLVYLVHIERDAISVDLSFTPDQSLTHLLLPPRASAVTYSDELMEETSNPRVKQIMGKKGQEISIHYEIALSTKWDPIDHPKPWIERDFFHIEGHQLFAYPVVDHDGILSVSIHWDIQGHLANSFGVDERLQAFSTSLWDFKRAIFLGGHIEVNRLEVEKQPVYIVASRSHSKKLEPLYGKIESLILYQRQIFDDHAFPVYLVAVLENPKEWGMAFTGATCIYAPKGKLDNVLTFFSHEHFHIWNGIRIHQKNSNQGDHTWFMEGFTEYYSHLSALQTGVYTEGQFLNKINQMVREYERSSAKNLSYRKIIAKRETDYSCRRMVYLKGLFFAMHLDKQIRTQSEGQYTLDDFMKLLYHKTYDEKREISLELIERSVTPFYPGAFSKELDDYIFSGKTIPIQEIDSKGLNYLQTAPL